MSIYCVHQWLSQVFVTHKARFVILGWTSYSRFMENPAVMHIAVVKQIFRYLKVTLEFGLVYIQGGGTGLLVGYTDSDHGADQVERRSTGGMAFYLGENLISWCSQKQKTVALSSCESEFMAATAAARQALWLRNLVSEITEDVSVRASNTLYPSLYSWRTRAKRGAVTLSSWWRLPCVHLVLAFDFDLSSFVRLATTILVCL